MALSISTCCNAKTIGKGLGQDVSGKYRICTQCNQKCSTHPPPDPKPTKPQ